MEVETKKAKEPEKPLSEQEQKAEERKNMGNEAYKNKDFTTSLRYYNEALELDPGNVVYILNRAGELRL